MVESTDIFFGERGGSCVFLDRGLCPQVNWPTSFIYGPSVARRASDAQVS